MTKPGILRSAVGLSALGWVALAPSMATAAMGGPPLGRVDETYRQEQSPPPPAATAPPAETSTPSPTPAPTPTTAPAPGVGADSQQRRRRLPIFQHPAQPIEATPTTPQAVPAPGDQGVMYVPGFRQILSGHRQNYFISGVSKAQHLVKFQYSIKSDLWPNATRHSAYFGFTQRSLWRLWDFSASSPFVESNYTPEIFYGYYPKVGDVVPAPGRLTYFIDYVRAGLEHESNGLDASASRGWNRVYASARLGAYIGVNHYVSIAPTAWAPPFGASDNPDITEFLGYGSLGLDYGYDPASKRWWGGFSVGATVWKGANSDFHRGALEIAGQWRPGYEGKFVEWWKFTPYFYVQLYDGYGETLSQYNQRVSSVRIGFAIEDRVNWITLPKSTERVAPN
jgi:outer membrane phospholipase A